MHAQDVNCVAQKISSVSGEEKKIALESLLTLHLAEVVVEYQRHQPALHLAGSVVCGTIHAARMQARRGPVA